MYGSGVGTGMAAVAAIPAVQRILQDRIPAVTGYYVAAVVAATPQAVPSRTGSATTPTTGAAATASASSALHGNPFWHRNTHGLCKRPVPKLQKAALFAIVCRFLVLRLETPVLGTAMSKSSRIRHSPNSGTVCRFTPWNVFLPLKPAF